MLSAAPAAVALCDLRMPGHDGLWLADQLRREHPDTAVIIATGVNDVGAAVESLRQGVVDYLTKPFERDRLCEAVSRGVEWHRAAVDARRWREALEDEMQARLAHLEELIASQFVDSDDDLDVLLSTLMSTTRGLRARPSRRRSGRPCRARARARTGDITSLERAALLHDIGKLAMPEAVLRKPAPLTLEEQRLIRLHPRIAAELIAAVPYLARAAAVVRDVHERIDGLGYPNGRRGTSGPRRRIISVADAYDTMTGPRVFRDAITPGRRLSGARTLQRHAVRPRSSPPSIGSSAD